MVPGSVCSDKNLLVKLAISSNSIGDNEERLNIFQKMKGGQVACSFAGLLRQQYEAIFAYVEPTLLLLWKIGLSIVQSVFPLEKSFSLSNELHSILPFK